MLIVAYVACNPFTQSCARPLAFWIKFQCALYMEHLVNPKKTKPKVGLGL